jgi:menaquinol-cytochrome c reductase iron-sulfur subunit
MSLSTARWIPVEPFVQDEIFKLSGSFSLMPTDSPHSKCASPEDESRRNFISKLTAGLTGLLGLVMMTGPLGMLLDPILRRRPGAKGDAWSSVGALGRFSVGAAPMRIVLKQDQEDAWLSRPGVAVGSVLVQRIEKDEFRVFSGICPHLGCSVGYKEGGTGFLCPCHKSRFSLDGSREEIEGADTNPSPRGLDPLEWRIHHGALQVRWQRFEVGVSERISLS